MGRSRLPQGAEVDRPALHIPQTASFPLSALFQVHSNRDSDLPNTVLEF